MNKFKEQFKAHVSTRPDAIALANTFDSISYAALDNEVNTIRKLFKLHESQRIAIALPNSFAWVAVDLASTFSKLPCIPIPHFFSSTQIEHLINDAGIDTVVLEESFQNHPGFQSLQIESRYSINVLDQCYSLIKLNSRIKKQTLPDETLKISYTSGTTGIPKGVIISSSEVDKVVTSLNHTLNASINDRHLCALPFSLLLENIAGIYTCLAAGGQCLVPDFSQLGLAGSSSLDLQKFIKTLNAYQPSTMITVPALAQALVTACEELDIRFDSFRFIAVGGAPLSESIFTRADALGLPLYEGYGLTECNSVVALNTPEKHKAGSVGMPLPHVEIKISETGEILVKGAISSGYLSDEDNRQSQLIWATGDLGYIDEDGFLFISGRKRTIFCTAFGRNVSPEWVERELICQPQINQALIYGEGKSFNLAIIVPVQHTTDEELDKAIDTANRQLPDYAQIGQWVRAVEPYSIGNNQLSASGVIQRHQILSDYKIVIENFYQ